MDRVSVSSFDPNDPTSCPLLMELDEVSAVLRHEGTRTVWDLTNTAPENGGLPYTPTGNGTRRQKRLVHRDDLNAFIERRRMVKSLLPVRNRMNTRRTEKSNSSVGVFMELISKRRASEIQDNIRVSNISEMQLFSYLLRLYQMIDEVVLFKYTISRCSVNREVELLNRKQRRRGHAVNYSGIREEAKDRLVRRVKRRLHERRVHLSRKISREDRRDGGVDLVIETPNRINRLRATDALYPYGKRDRWRI